MARKVVTVTLGPECGRDAGKAFVITEMSARKADKWATRAFLALTRSGIDVPEEIVSLGVVGLAMVGLKAIGGVAFADAEPLLDEMATCWQIIPDPSRPDVVRAMMPDGSDIEEIGTWSRLRLDTLELHAGFSLAAVRSIWTRVAAVASASSTTST